MRSLSLCVLYACACLVVIASVRADGEGEAAVKDDVVVLTTSTFDAEIAKQPLALVEFYAPWCGHCKRLAPEYSTAATELLGKNAGILAKVDCTVETAVCNKQGVRGYPTLKLFRNDGSAAVAYEGGRTSADIVQFMIKQAAPSVADLKSYTDLEEMTSESIKLVGFATASTNLAAYKRAANALRNDYSFGVFVDVPQANARFGVTPPALLLLRDFDEGNIPFPGGLESPTLEADLARWLKINAFPVIGPLDSTNTAKYQKRGFNFVHVFIEPENEEHEQLVQNAIRPLALKYRTQLSFVTQDGVSESGISAAKSLALSGKKVPAIVFEHRLRRKNFVFDENAEITNAAVDQFVDDVLWDKVAPAIKSEEEPADNNGPVKVLTGKSFTTIVNDKSKDVFVEFYAPWCGHCKSLSPKWEELGKMFSNDPTTVIAKVDATANDLPAQINGFPTLVMYPANNKKGNLKFEGTREVKDMYDWVIKHKKKKAPAAAAAAHTEL